jgi:Phosphoinositide phospholipase C, Ca2+-dependent
MFLRRVFTAVALAVIAAVSAPGLAGASGRPVRMNEIQVIGTHNSYHRELTQVERAAHDAIYGGAPIYENLRAYSHASLPNQLRRQGVRGLELDLYPDPQGGRYVNPLLRRRLAAGPLTDPEWYRPGIKVIHTADLDYNSSCVRLVGCLRLVQRWSRANAGHVPLLILLELKGTDPVAGALGGVSVPPWDRAALDALDSEIRSVFPPRELITPDFVRRRDLTLQQSVLRRGWPTLRRARGRIMFLLDNDPGAISAAYTAGRPSLRGRVLFTNSRPGRPDAAFVKRNDPTGANLTQIRRLVRTGYLVRTRSDEPLATVLSRDTTRRRAALASGAQLVSTDFPEVGMSARYDRDYVVALPGGVPARCNPVIRPRGCRSRTLERPRGVRPERWSGRPRSAVKTASSSMSAIRSRLSRSPWVRYRPLGGVLVDDELSVRNEERGPVLGFNVWHQRTSVEDRTSLRSRWKRLQT